MSPADRPNNRERINELEGIRGIWTVLILIFHATQHPIFFGWSRVDLFFVISGYLATRNLVKPTCIVPSLTKSLTRRLFRLLPAYYSVIAFLTIFNCLYSTHSGTFARPLAVLTLTQNLPLYWSDESWSYYPLYLEHTWTLAIEVQFFLVLLVVHALFGSTALTPLAFTFLINSVFLRANGLHPWTLVGRADGFALGIFLALLLEKRGRLGRRKIQFVVYLSVLIGLGYISWFLTGDTLIPKAFDRPLDVRESLAVLANNIFYTGLVGSVVIHAGHPILWLLRARWPTRLGKMSYGIYLYSFIAIKVAESLVGSVPGIGIGWSTMLALGLAITAAAASHAGLERPLLKKVS